MRLKQLSEMCDTLVDTMDNLSDALIEFELEDLTEKEKEYINKSIRMCNVCGWWSYIEDMKLSEKNEYTCSDCWMIVEENADEL